MLCIGQDNVLAYCAETILQCLDNGHEREVDEHDVVLGVIDDVIQLFRKQARIQGMADGAVTHDAEPGFHMAFGIPGHGGNAVAQFHAFQLKGFGNFQ